MESKVRIIGECILIFFLTIIMWHVYRFIATFSPYKSYLEWGTLLGYPFYLAFYILMFAVLLFFVRYINHSSLENVGLSLGARWKIHIIIGVCFAFAARFLEIGLGALVGGIVVVSSYSSLFLVMFFIVDTVFVGLSEEGIFRGYIQRKLTDAWKFLPALLFTSILFHIYHVNFFAISASDLILKLLAIAPNFGIFVGYFYYRSHGKLWGPIMLHMFYDLFGTIVPLGVDVSEVNLALVSVSKILIWSTLIIVLKLLADKTQIFSD